MSVELLDEGVEDSVAICVSWLKDLEPGRVSNKRIPGAPLPAIWVVYIDGTENVEESTAEDLVSIHYLASKGDGGATAFRVAEAGARNVHQRMLLLGRYLEDVPLPGGRVANMDFCDVAKRPSWEEYGDEQILRKVGRYRIGLSYAKLS